MTEHVVDSKVLVAIIDQKPVRREGLKKAFIAADADVVCFFPSGDDDVASVPSSPPTKGYLVRLWHATDFHSRPTVPAIDAFCTIYFSGNGGLDKKIPEQAEDRIYRPVGDAIGLPTPQEAREIVDYVLALARGESVRKPLILQPPLDRSLLQSLAILAQGYLVVYAEYLKGRNEVLPGNVAELLVACGWSISKDGSLAISPGMDVAKQFENLETGVQAAQWWDVFGLFGADSERAEAGWNAFVGDLKCELQRGADAGLPDALSQFLDLLKRGRVSSPEAVAALLQFLRPILEGSE